ncbi:type II toxin-antitoxin system YafO family toxin [Pantoea ananatis]|uniref:type II toxin-antitoxin system YafO family toxin n=1 Tax=Pantoea ananas TaxID=553 RepID=UPI001FF1A6C0|nr:type II toxin-antitoxin system YafO family toxin [Pantoea ananatis]MCK0552588.1 type II toxin-antitoxin system YafO family toxin [Pantoea ananatis]
MSVTVTYNQKSYDFFFRPIFLEHPHLEQSLLDDFKRYKETNVLPDYFGRDTNYLRPDDIKNKKLMHIHLALHGKKLKTPDGDGIDANTKQWNRTSDSALIYAQNAFDESHYSLIALFDPGAHIKAKNYPRMRVLAKYCEEFRQLIF